jgi:hypothetical protein
VTLLCQILGVDPACDYFTVCFEDDLSLQFDTPREWLRPYEAPEPDSTWDLGDEVGWND